MLGEDISFLLLGEVSLVSLEEGPAVLVFFARADGLKMGIEDNWITCGPDFLPSRNVVRFGLAKENAGRGEQVINNLNNYKKILIIVQIKF